MPKTIIIGAGIAGIATSIRLANKGHDVYVYEANIYPGGKLTSFTKDGFRFDAGPSLFTLPNLVEELFELCGENPSDYFQYSRNETVCNYFWEDGTRFSMPDNIEHSLNSISNTFDVDEDKVRMYLDKSRLKYEATAPIFIEKSLHKLSTFFSLETLKAMFLTHKMDLFDTLDEVNSKAFDGNEKLIQLFNRFATYNGSSPYKTPGIMSMIPHLEMVQGSFFPKGGMESITNSLVALAERQGVQFCFESPVDRVVVKNRRASGIMLKGDFIDSDYVISNMDVFSSYSRLLKDQKQPKKILSQERSSSALIFYWGVRGSYSELDLHNIIFSEDYKYEFDHIFKQKKLYEDPTVYINISSKENPSDALDNHENWFVMINTPGNFNQDWDEEIIRARKFIMEKISRILDFDLEVNIVSESILDPRLIELRTSSHNGSLYGTASNDRYAAFLRHPNFSRSIEGLFFVGGSVHPGGGIPLCLNSAKIVGNLIG